MKPLYIIPARGGSKGLPDKNIRMLGGKPLIAWSIEAARQAALTLGGTIMLSTDSEKIALEAINAGVNVPWLRPAELATDTASSRAVMLHAMYMADAHGIEYDVVILLQPTSPLRTAQDILTAADIYSTSPGTDMVVSVCVSDDNPYYNLFETDKAGNLHVCKGNGLLTRRQDAPLVYKYNGAVYVIRPESLRNKELGAFERRMPYVMPADRSIDIDSLRDLERAEEILRQGRSHGADAT